MKQLLVKDLVEALMSLDQNLPIHRLGPMAEVPPCAVENLPNWIGVTEVMKSKNSIDDYYALANDGFWANEKERFNTPFKAVVIA